MNIARCSHAKPALKRCAQVRQNVSEEIACNNHIILRRFKHHEHRHSINILMIGFDAFKASGDFLKNSLPQIASVSLNVRLVGHSHAPSPMLLCILERRDDDSLNASPRIQFLLRSNLILSSLLQKSARAAVSAFGVLTKDYEVNV